MHPRIALAAAVGAASAVGALAPAGASAQTVPSQLVGDATLGPDTFAAGPTSGQFITPPVNNGRTSPFVNQQPVQGFSAILAGQAGGFQVLTDNGFGAKANSADSLLRFHNIGIDFKRAGGIGTGQFFASRLWALTRTRTPLPACREALSQTGSRASLPSAAESRQTPARNRVATWLTGRPSTNRSIIWSIGPVSRRGSP